MPIGVYELAAVRVAALPGLIARHVSTIALLRIVLLLPLTTLGLTIFATFAIAILLRPRLVATLRIRLLLVVVRHVGRSCSPRASVTPSDSYA